MAVTMMTSQLRPRTFSNDGYDNTVAMGGLRSDDSGGDPFVQAPATGFDGVSLGDGSPQDTAQQNYPSLSGAAPAPPSVNPALLGAQLAATPMPAQGGDQGGRQAPGSFDPGPTDIGGMAGQAPTLSMPATPTVAQIQGMSPEQRTAAMQAMSSAHSGGADVGQGATAMNPEFGMSDGEVKAYDQMKGLSDPNSNQAYKDMLMDPSYGGTVQAGSSMAPKVAALKQYGQDNPVDYSKGATGDERYLQDGTYYNGQGNQIGTQGANGMVAGSGASTLALPGQYNAPTYGGPGGASPSVGGYGPGASGGSDGPGGSSMGMRYSGPDARGGSGMPQFSNNATTAAQSLPGYLNTFNSSMSDAVKGYGDLASQGFQKDVGTLLGNMNGIGALRSGAVQAGAKDLMTTYGQQVGDYALQTAGQAASLANSAAQNDVNAAESRYGTNIGAQTSMYGTNVNAATSRYNNDSSNATSRYGIDVGSATSRYGTDVGAASSRYSTDVGARTAQNGLNAQMGYNYAALGQNNNQFNSNLAYQKEADSNTNSFKAAQMNQDQYEYTSEYNYRKQADQAARSAANKGAIGKVLGGVAGGVIGAFAGGPAGAIAGAKVGSSVFG